MQTIQIINPSNLSVIANITSDQYGYPLTNQAGGKNVSKLWNDAVFIQVSTYASCVSMRIASSEQNSGDPARESTLCTRISEALHHQEPLNTNFCNDGLVRQRVRHVDFAETDAPYKSVNSINPHFNEPSCTEHNSWHPPCLYQ